MKPGKYDPPNKEEILNQYPQIRTIGEIISGKPFNTVLPEKAKDGEGSSRASEELSSQTPIKRGRKAIVTPPRIEIVCEVLSKGGSERAACLKAGIGSTAWNHAKKTQEELRVKIVAVREVWAQLKYKRHMHALYESQSMRAATHKAKRPKPTHQAKMVMWYLTTRIPLNVVALTREQEQKACEEFNYFLDQWDRQKTAFGLMKKTYKKRAELRGQNPQELQAERAESMKRFVGNNGTVFGANYGVP